MKEKTLYVLTDKERGLVEELKALLERMPKEPGFDPALEFKLGLCQLLVPFVPESDKFADFFKGMRDVLFSE
jgi:hypothetical protein